MLTSLVALVVALVGRAQVSQARGLEKVEGLGETTGFANLGELGSNLLRGFLGNQLCLSVRAFVCSRRCCKALASIIGSANMQNNHCLLLDADKCLSITEIFLQIGSTVFHRHVVLFQF